MKARPWLCWIAALYLGSLALPAFGLSSARDGYGTPGVVCLILFPWVLLHPAWYANWALLGGCLYLANGKLGQARAVGIAASALALSFFPMIGVDNVRPGAFVWAACPVLLAFGSHRLLARARDFEPRMREDRSVD